MTFPSLDGLDSARIWEGRYRPVLLLAWLVFLVLAGLVAFGVLAQLIH